MPIDRVATKRVESLTPKRSTKLAGFDVYIRDQWHATEQSPRIE